MRAYLSRLKRVLAKFGFRAPARAPQDLRGAYIAHVEEIKAGLPHDVAMQEAVGGQFELVGWIETALVRKYGLEANGYLIDVGCGSGRLAKPLSAYLTGKYLGIDVVPKLLAHAAAIVGRPDWKFQVVKHIGIPEAAERADMVCFFSVMTHLLHEQSYWYLEEAKRVLKPGGRVVFSFLEFADPGHWRVFSETIDRERHRLAGHLNVFIERSAIRTWAHHLDMDVEDIRDGTDRIVTEGHLGQAVCVLRKRAS